ncbi:MAG: signal peptide peptidase SppA, partial [Bacteroidia bacterium]
MLGFIIGSIVLVFLLAGMIGALASGFSQEPTEVTVEDNSVLKIRINYEIPDRTNKNGLDFSAFAMDGAPKAIGLNDILSNIKKAAKDDKIKGILLELDLTNNSYATLEEIRKELIEFKKSKKFILAYAEMMDEHGYYLAATADKIYINPSGELLLNGFASQVVYLKGAFDKLGLEPQLIRHGKYKSAGEPLISEHMSNENRKQIESYMGSLYHHFVENIAKDRKKSATEVEDIINKLAIREPMDAVKLGMIDSLKYEDQIEEELKSRLGLKSDDKLSMVGLAKYKNTKTDISTADEKIAVIYCTGDIVSGKSTDGSMGSETICEAIKKVRNDKKFKALVLRINSPGGSALASDVIWREIVLTKKEKPVVVSMGEVAASGGYFIAAPADVIVAQPNTITGSIGVFGLLMNAQKLVRDKLGINVETVKFGEFADLGSPERPLNNSEKEIIQHAIDKIYNDFVGRVAEGRKMTAAQVDSIAQGRVWSGKEAKSIGLVDEFGGLDKAIEIAAKKAKTSDYRIVNLPEQKDPFQEILTNLKDNASVYLMEKELGENYRWLRQIQGAAKMQGIQARMDFNLKVD